MIETCHNIYELFIIYLASGWDISRIFYPFPIDGFSLSPNLETLANFNAFCNYVWPYVNTCLDTPAPCPCLPSIACRLIMNDWLHLA